MTRPLKVAEEMPLSLAPQNCSVLEADAYTDELIVIQKLRAVGALQMRWRGKRFRFDPYLGPSRGAVAQSVERPKGLSLVHLYLNKVSSIPDCVF